MVRSFLGKFLSLVAARYYEQRCPILPRIKNKTILPLPIRGILSSARVSVEKHRLKAGFEIPNSEK